MSLIIISLTFIFCLPISYSFECYIPGKCNGNPYKIESLANVELCIGTCSIKTKCRRSTFNPDLHHCSLFMNEECSEIVEEECKRCITSEKECIFGK